MDYCFEQGPIRPPSEATSLLLRVTRNCPWNKCAFCHTYRGSKFELRSVDEIKKDIQAMKDMADKVTGLSWEWGEGGHVNRSVLQRIYNSRDFDNDCLYTVAAWLYFGGENVFLQDANSLILKTADLLAVLDFLNSAGNSVISMRFHALLSYLKITYGGLGLPHLLYDRHKRGVVIM